MLQVRLWQFGKLLPSRLGDHMEHHGVSPVLYVSAWLLTSFASDYPLHVASRVMDVVLADSVQEGMMKVCADLLSTREHSDRGVYLPGLRLASRSLQLMRCHQPPLTHGTVGLTAAQPDMCNALQVALGMVVCCEKQLLGMDDMEEMVDLLKTEVRTALSRAASSQGIVLWEVSQLPGLPAASAAAVATEPVVSSST